MECDEICDISKVIENNMESIFVNIKMQSKKKLKVGCIYRSPNTILIYSITNFLPTRITGTTFNSYRQYIHQ